MLFSLLVLLVQLLMMMKIADDDVDDSLWLAATLNS